MLAFNEILAQILALKSDLTREALNALIVRKREGIGRFLTEEGAAYMVANDLGIDLSGGALKTGIGVKDLVVGASDVSLTGRVLAVYRVSTFKRRNGVEGKVARFAFADDDGSLNVVLWDEKAEMIERRKLAVNSVVRVNHGYVRKDRDGHPEIHVGRRGSVVVLKPDPDGSSPPHSRPFTKMRDLRDDGAFVNLQGVVNNISRISTFERADGRQGRVSSLRLVDDTGRIRIVFWDEKTDLPTTWKRGDALKIVQGQIRRGLGGRLEVHVGRTSQITVLSDSSLKALDPVVTAIRTLKSGMNDVDVLGRVVMVDEARDFQRSSGEVGRVASLYLADASASIRLTLWDENVDLLRQVAIGDAVFVEGAYTRGDSVGVTLNLGRFGTITVCSDLPEVQTLPSMPGYRIPIGQLQIGGVAFVEGVVVESPAIRTVVTKDGREVSVASTRIRDDTGEVGVALWDRLVEEVADVTVGTTIRINGAYVRDGYDGAPEVSSRRTTVVEVLKTYREAGTRGGNDESSLKKKDGGRAVLRR
jgi:replication factor A1